MRVLCEVCAEKYAKGGEKRERRRDEKDACLRRDLLSSSVEQLVGKKIERDQGRFERKMKESRAYLDVVSDEVRSSSSAKTRTPKLVSLTISTKENET